jgi:hypothetical protein
MQSQADAAASLHFVSSRGTRFLERQIHFSNDGDEIGVITLLGGADGHRFESGLLSKQTRHYVDGTPGAKLTCQAD